MIKNVKHLYPSKKIVILPSLTRLEALSPSDDNIASYDSISSKLASGIFPFYYVLYVAKVSYTYCFHKHH